VLFATDRLGGQLSLALQHQSGLVSCPFGRYVAFLIRTNKQLRQKFDFRRARSIAFVLSNRDGLLRYESSGVGCRCTPKVHLLTMRTLKTMLTLPSGLHPIECIG